MRFITVIASVLVVAICVVPARSTVVLDQSVVPVGDPSIGLFTETSSVAQVFTVGKLGTLDHINVLMRVSNTSSGNLDFDVRPTLAGAPVAGDSQALLTGQVSSTLFPVFPPSNTWAWITLDVSSSHLAVTPGEVLALVLTPATAAGAYEWGAQTLAGYTGGQAYSRGTGNDPWEVFPPPSSAPGYAYGFQTFVRTPEPSTLILAVIGGLALLAYRKRR